MAPDKHYIVESSSSEDEINVDKMVETKQAVDKVPLAHCCCICLKRDWCAANRCVIFL